MTAGQGALPRVFVSYASRDHEAAFRLCNGLESAGVPCWIAPRDIPAGADWGGSITEAIDACTAMVLVFSRNADNSNQIKKELVLASDAGKLVIPARVEELVPRNPSFRYELAMRQWVDLFGDWHSGMGQILARVKHQGGPPPAAPPPVEPVAPPPQAAPRSGTTRRNLVLAGVAVLALGAGGYAVFNRYRLQTNTATAQPTPAPAPTLAQEAAKPVPVDVTTAMNAVITNGGNPANVRAGPKPGDRQVAQLASGTQIRVVDDIHTDNGGWARITAPTNGWIAKSALSALPPPAGYRTNAVAASDVGPVVALRSGPGPTNSQVGEIPNGTALRIVADRAGWVQIDLPQNGWIIKWAYKHELRQ